MRDLVIFILPAKPVASMFGGMDKRIDVGQIQARRKRVEAEIVEHETALVALRAEMADLDVTERVVARLTAGKRGNGTAAPEALPENKPPNIPPVTDMIKEALTNAHSAGSSGLEPTGMLTYIQERYWPGATTNQVGPIAWRMWKNGKLEKYGARYKLLKEERDKEKAASTTTTDG